MRLNNKRRRGEREGERENVGGMWERSAKSPAKCREIMQWEEREFVGKDLLLGKGTVSFQAINKGTLWENKEEGQ